MIDRGKRSKTLNEVKPVENINNPQIFLEMSLKQKEVLQRNCNRARFVCTDFPAHKMVLRTRSCKQNHVCNKTVTVGINLRRLIYNLLIVIIFPTHATIS